MKTQCKHGDSARNSKRSENKWVLIFYLLFLVTIWLAYGKPCGKRCFAYGLQAFSYGAKFDKKNTYVKLTAKNCLVVVVAVAVAVTVVVIGDNNGDERKQYHWRHDQSDARFYLRQAYVNLTAKFAVHEVLFLLINNYNKTTMATTPNFTYVMLTAKTKYQMLTANACGSLRLPSKSLRQQIYMVGCRQSLLWDKKNRRSSENTVQT